MTASGSLVVVRRDNAGKDETFIRITAAGTAAGTSVDLAKLGAEVIAMGAIERGAGGNFAAPAAAQVLRLRGIEGLTAPFRDRSRLAARIPSRSRWPAASARSARR